MLNHLNAAPQAPRRAVVIGAGGFVGGAVADMLERQKVNVRRVTRQDVDLLAPDAAAKLADLLEPGDSLVAASALAPCKNAQMLKDNVTVALAIVTAVKNADLAHILNIGSDAIYADSVTPLTEASVTAPDSLHGVMHLARETMFRAEVSAPTAFLRPTLIFGARDPHNGYGPNRFRRLAAEGKPIILFGEGEERRDHVSVDDVAELASRILFQRSTGVLNAATGTVTSFGDIARLAVRIAGTGAPIQSSPRSGPMPHNGLRPFDASGTKRAFPEFEYTALAEGMAKAQGA
jgi:UDP-glucose 4-epimerase